ncbi:MAG: endonuclease/exonuclease/phosphatase family protein [Parachlamydiales bacterium]
MRWLLLLLFSLPLFGALSESVLPAIEAAYAIGGEKFTKRQWEEITAAKGRERLRVVTYNMLFNLYDWRHAEAYRWPARLPRIAEWIRAADADLIATQELHRDQVEGLLALIGEEYAFYGHASTLLGVESEINGIFYRKGRFELVFAESPSMSEYDPYSSMSRRLTIAHFRDGKTGAVFGLINAHHSFSSADSRECSVRFTLDRLGPLMGDMPLIVVGDMNTFPTRIDVDLPFYDGHYLHRLFMGAGFQEAYDRALLGHVGPISTFTNAPDQGKTVFMGTGTPGVVLDHIYVNGKVEVMIHAVDPARVDGYFPSDHMPVIADLVL